MCIYEGGAAAPARAYPLLPRHRPPADCSQQRRPSRYIGACAPPPKPRPLGQASRAAAACQSAPPAPGARRTGEGGEGARLWWGAPCRPAACWAGWDDRKMRGKMLLLGALLVDPCHLETGSSFKRGFPLKFSPRRGYRKRQPFSQRSHPCTQRYSFCFLLT